MRPTRLLRSSLPPTIRSILSSTPTPSASGSSSTRGTNGSSSASSSVGSSSNSSSSRSDSDSGDCTIHGWLTAVRSHKKVTFVHVSDGSATAQAVFKHGSRDPNHVSDSNGSSETSSGSDTSLRSDSSLGRDTSHGSGGGDGSDGIGTRSVPANLSVGASVRLTGRLSASRGAGQAKELVVDEAEVLGTCDPEEYPIQKKELSATYLRQNAHLRFRTASAAALTRTRDGLMRDWHDWFEDAEFTHIHTPILTSSDCEGGGETFTLRDASPESSTQTPSTSSSTLPLSPFHTSSASTLPLPSPPISPSLPSPSNPVADAITPPLPPLPSPTTPTPEAPSPSPSPPPSTPEPFFPHPVNLTVSSQLHLEAPTHALTRTYTLSPCFRAEPSVTSRHLCEFYMLEAEVAFVSTLDALLDVVEDGIRSVLDRLVHSSGARATRMRQDLKPESLAMLESVISAPFGRMTYTCAMEVLRERHKQEPFKAEPQWGLGISTEQEKWLAGDAGRPVFVTHFPAAIKPFYMLPSDAVPSSFSSGPRAEAGSEPGSEPGSSLAPGPTVAAFDLLVPGLGELIGGSLREHRLAPLEAAIQAAGLKTDEYEWYLSLRRYGSVPHGGWGMGFDRWIMWVTGTGNVREVVPFPRWKGHCQY